MATRKRSARKKDLLKRTVRHIDIKSFNADPIMTAMGDMSFTARDTARATDIFDRMLRDKSCSVFLTLAGSTSAAGCMQVYVDMVKHNMVDAIVATGASIVDMDFFEALGYKHYQGSPAVDDTQLRSLYIDRIYDTFIDEEELQACDRTVAAIADSLEPRPYSSREFITEMGKYLVKHSKKKDSLIETAYRKGVPIFCPAFSDSSAGLGLIYHQWKRPHAHIAIDSVKDFLEVTKVKLKARTTGIFMIGGGVPKNFVQDTVIGAEVLGKNVPMHKYSIQITVADARDGALSGSTLKEASSWGKVKQGDDQMVFAEATSVMPLIASAVYHRGGWKKRKPRAFNTWLSAGGKLS